MKKVDDAVKWICGMALLIGGLWLLSQFVSDYQRASADLNAAGIRSH